MKISACLIVKNEAANIGRCLDSMKNIVQQIVVMDTGSIDDTIEIARAYGAEIYAYEWCDDFAAAKNAALEKATGDWIVFLDADEYFSEQSSENIPDLIKKYEEQCDGFMMQMVNIDVDKNNEVLDEFFVTRVFRNDPNMRFVREVHEYLENKTGRRNLWYRVEASDVKLFHTGYSSKRVKSKCERNLKLLLEKLKENPHDINLYRYLADVYYGLGEYEKAVQYAQMDIDTGRKDISYASRSYRVLINSLKIQQKDFLTMETAIKKAIEDFPALPDFYAEYGLLFFQEMQCDEAESMLAKALQLFKNYNEIETSILQININVIYYVLGNIYEYKHDYKKAIEFYQKILMERKYAENVFMSLYKLIAKEDPVYNIAFLNTIYDKTKQSDLEFLVSNIKKFQRGKILAYYIQRLNHLLKSDSVEVLALECVQAYKRSEHFLVETINQDSAFSTLAAILLNDYKKIEKHIDGLLSNYQTVVLRFYEKRKIALNINDFEAYKTILCALLHTDEPQIIQKYCQYAMDFDLIQMLVLARILKDNFIFFEAKKLYQQVLSFEIVDGKKDILYDFAYCHYKMEEYEMAVIYFKQAIALGYNNKEIKLLLEWSQENLANQIKQVESK